MTITEAILSADSKEEIFALLTYYLDALRSGENIQRLPETLTKLPLAGANDLRRRIERLNVELDAASKNLDNRTCQTILEAQATFLAAIHWLDSSASPEYRESKTAVCKRTMAPHRTHYCVIEVDKRIAVKSKRESDTILS